LIIGTCAVGGRGSAAACVACRLLVLVAWEQMAFVGIYLFVMAVFDIDTEMFGNLMDDFGLSP
jgi:hypothetical protein